MDARAPLLARALLLGERIDTIGLEQRDVISTTPLAAAIGEGLVVVFRYGVLVMIGLSPPVEEQVLARVLPRVHEPLDPHEEEAIPISAGDDREDGVSSSGAFRVGALSPETLLVVADALAKSVALAENERHIEGVFDTMEPWARRLATGRSPGGRREMTRLVGQGLLVRHRLAERVAVRDKPDILWDRPDLERLYARLEDEYELIERDGAVARKLDLIDETVTVMTDLIDTRRSLGLELAVVVLIVAEIGLGLLEMVRA